MNAGWRSENMSEQINEQTGACEFTELAKKKRASFITEYIYMLRNNRKYWMLPLILVFLAFGALMVASSSGLAPFIYTLF